MTSGLFLATSSSTSMKILDDLSLPGLVFDCELTDSVNVIMQLINVTVVDNNTAMEIRGGNEGAYGGESANSCLNASLEFVGEMYWQTAKWSSFDVECCCDAKVPHHVFVPWMVVRRDATRFSLYDNFPSGSEYACDLMSERTRRDQKNV